MRRVKRRGTHIWEAIGARECSGFQSRRRERARQVIKEQRREKDQEGACRPSCPLGHDRRSRVCKYAYISFRRAPVIIALTSKSAIPSARPSTISADRRSAYGNLATVRASSVQPSYREPISRKERTSGRFAEMSDVRPICQLVDGRSRREMIRRT